MGAVQAVLIGWWQGATSATSATPATSAWRCSASRRSQRLRALFWAFLRFLLASLSLSLSSCRLRAFPHRFFPPPRLSCLCRFAASRLAARCAHSWRSCCSSSSLRAYAGLEVFWPYNTPGKVRLQIRHLDLSFARLRESAVAICSGARRDAMGLAELVLRPCWGLLGSCWDLQCKAKLLRSGRHPNTLQTWPSRPHCCMNAAHGWCGCVTRRVRSPKQVW